jgi:hypothetical protein
VAAVVVVVVVVVAMRGASMDAGDGADIDDMIY